MKSDNVPLVSMYVRAWNVGPYIEECLKSVFAQTYSPLEIVIAEDRSTDNTWDVICNVVDEYRRSGGKHQVIVHRNEVNLGNAPNCEMALKLCHGELCVQVDGDDIHLPNRVERIVEEWLKTGKKATVIWNGWHLMDNQGHVIALNQKMYHKEFPDPFGAVMAYKRDAVLGFSPMENLYHDDVVLAYRSRMNPGGGGVLIIDSPLTIYRLGGVSNGGGARAKTSMGNKCLCAVERLERDIDEVAVGRRVPERMIQALREQFAGMRYRGEMMVKKYGGSTLAERWDGFMHHPSESHKIFGKQMFFVLFPCLTECFISPMIRCLNGYFRRWKCRNLSVEVLLGNSMIK